MNTKDLLSSWPLPISILVLFLFFIMIYYFKKIIPMHLNNFFEKKKIEFIEDLKGISDRILKIQNKEFEILPELWRLLQTCLFNIQTLTCPFQSFNNLNSLTEDELKLFIDKSDFEDLFKKKILSAKDKQAEYINSIRYKRYNELTKVMNDLNLYLSCNQIFLSPDISNGFTKLCGKLTEMVHLLKVYISRDDFDKINEVYTEFNKISLKPIEELIKKRLHFDVVK